MATVVMTVSMVVIAMCANWTFFYGTKQSTACTIVYENQLSNCDLSYHLIWSFTIQYTETELKQNKKHNMKPQSKNVNGNSNHGEGMHVLTYNKLITWHPLWHLKVFCLQNELVGGKNFLPTKQLCCEGFYNMQVLKIKITFRLLRSTGQRTKISTATVIVVKACHMVGRRDARQTDAKIAALSDNDCETLQFTTQLKSSDMHNRCFYFGSVFENTLIRFGMSLVRFGSKNTVRFGSDIIVIYYSCN